MRAHILRMIGLFGAAALSLVALSTPAEAGTAGHRPAYCVTVTADGVGQDLGGGRTQATLSVAGHVLGTTTAMFDIGSVSGSVASFTGPLVFTPDRVPGALTAELVGTFDVGSGVFAATSTSLTGAGALRGVTGSLTVNGTEDLANGTFTETLTAELCARHGHHQALQRAAAGR